MTTLRTTAIMKTDISGSTVRFRALEAADLDTLLSEHRQLVSRLAAAHDGRIVKPEGDGFWLVFPSVTAAALAAMSMQEELRLAQPGKGDDRLTMRIVLTLGDVIHQEGGLVGDAVVLAARIEQITPADEIYVSAAAWLAANQGEVRMSFVDSFALKGFPDLLPVYRVEQKHRTREIADPYFVITDLRSFGAAMDASPMTMTEKILDRLIDAVGRVCREFGGTNRFSAGDSYCLTFPEPDLAIAGVESLAVEWSTFIRAEDIPCPINVLVHKGVLYAFRSYLMSRDLDDATQIEGATRRLPPEDAGIFVTGQVRQDLLDTPWGKRFQPIDMPLTSPRLADIEVYRFR